jgi:benzoate membrane transport protein
MLAPQPNFLRNLRDLPGSMALSAVIAGLIVALVGYSGPLLIVIQAAQAGGLTDAQTSSWVWSVAIGYGVFSALLSIYYRQPLTSPWSTAGAVLLTTSLAHFTLPQAIGAYIVAGAAAVILGLTGWFGRLMSLIPQAIVMGMLGGILLRFGIDIFGKLGDNPTQNPILIVPIVITFFVLKRQNFRAPTLGALIVGVIIAALSSQIHIENVPLTLTTPVFTAPEFSLDVILTLALPLFLLALTTQYAPGVAVLRAAGYIAPINGLLVAIGGASMLLAPFGCHGLNLGALLAAIIANPEAHPDPDKRYSAGVAVGLWYTLFGLFGATVVSVLAGLPTVLITTVAGLALTGTLTSALANAMSEPENRDGAIVAFLCSAASFSLFNIGAPFWGLVAGVAVNALMQYRRDRVKTNATETVSEGR